jgi:hypothetical protein
MLIDIFSTRWIEELNERASGLDASSRLFLLIDGAFVPGLHNVIRVDQKALLFALLQGCNETAQDVSPFLVSYDPNEKQLRALLQRCNRWPMLSLIETAESMEELAVRLAAWCVVEADGQRFNFRFPDTRRLPAIIETLTQQQRGSFAGRIKRWTYVDRAGQWKDLSNVSCAEPVAADPVLDAHQFARLVDDRRADEFMVSLRNRGYDVFKAPSRSHSLLTVALRTASIAQLADDDIPQWCEWVWRQYQIHDDTAAALLMQSWMNRST